MPWGNRSLKVKLAFFATLLVLIVATSFSLFLRAYQKKAIVESTEAGQIVRANALAQVAREAILVEDDTNMVNFVNMERRSPSTAYAMVLGVDGNVRVHSDPALIGKKMDDDITRSALSQKTRQPVINRLKGEDESEIIDITVPVLMGVSPPELKGVVRIGFRKKEMDEEIARLLKEQNSRIVLPFILTLAIGLVGALALASLITNPLRTLSEGARRIGEGKLDHRIEIRTRDELHDLADEFNLMAQKLGELDRMKQDFVSNVTHELRSPMTSIRGYIDLILQNAAGPTTDLQRDYLSVIKNSAVRLGRFIDNLLDVAKIEAHKLKLTPEPLNIQSLAHEMEVLFKPQAGEKKIRLDNTIPGTLTQAFVDKDKLAEVFINLTSNAIKFTPDGGTVSFAATEGPNYLEVSVQDTGPGIPTDMVGKLFNKFEQVKSDAGHARKHKGTGLGLTIAKGIVEAHGGKIWIKSPGPSGVGTAFFFTIPKLTEELKARISAV